MQEHIEEYYKSVQGKSSVEAAELTKRRYNLTYEEAREIAMKVEVLQSDYDLTNEEMVSYRKYRLEKLYEWPNPKVRKHTYVVKEEVVKLLKKKTKIKRIIELFGVKYDTIAHWAIDEQVSLRNLGEPNRRSSPTKIFIVEILLSNYRPSLRSIAVIVGKTPERVRQIKEEWKARKLFKHF